VLVLGANAGSSGEREKATDDPAAVVASFRARVHKAYAAKRADAAAAFAELKALTPRLASQARTDDRLAAAFLETYKDALRSQAPAAREKPEAAGLLVPHLEEIVLRARPQRTLAIVERVSFNTERSAAVRIGALSRLLAPLWLKSDVEGKREILVRALADPILRVMAAEVLSRSPALLKRLDKQQISALKEAALSGSPTILMPKDDSRERLYASGILSKKAYTQWLQAQALKTDNTLRTRDACIQKLQELDAISKEKLQNLEARLKEDRTKQAAFLRTRVEDPEQPLEARQRSLARLKKTGTAPQDEIARLEQLLDDAEAAGK